MAGKKGRRPWGRIRQLPNKSRRWQASYVGPDTIRHNAPMTFTTKMDAEGWLIRERRLIEQDAWTPPSVRKAQKAALGITVSDYAATWVAQRTIKPRTRIFYEGLLTNHFVTLNMPLRQLSSETVRAWYHSLGTDHPTRNHHAYGLLRAVCATAVTDGLLATNPCVIRSKTPHTRQPVILTVAEVCALAEAMPAKLKALVLISAWCGLRWGEVIELRRKDVDDSAEIIAVRRAVTHRGQCRIATPKSGVGRTVAVPPHIRADLKHHLDTFVGKGPETLLFPARQTCHYNSSLFFRTFKPALASIGRTGVRVHDLRHFAGTQTARVGNLPETMERLGHSTPRASLIYQGIAAGRQLQMAEALSRLADGQ